MKKRLLYTILSISLLTVIAGAVIALIYILQAFLTRRKQILPGSLDVGR